MDERQNEQISEAVNGNFTIEWRSDGLLSVSFGSNTQTDR